MRVPVRPTRPTRPPTKQGEGAMVLMHEYKLEQENSEFFKENQELRHENAKLESALGADA